MIHVNPETDTVSPPQLVYADAEEPRARAAWVPENRYCYWRRTTLHLASLDGKEEAVPIDLSAVERYDVSLDGKWACVQGRNAAGQRAFSAIHLEQKKIETLLLSEDYQLAPGGITDDSREVIVIRGNNPATAEYAALGLDSKKLRKLKAPRNPLPARLTKYWPGLRKAVLVETDTQGKEDRLRVYDFETGEHQTILTAKHPERIQDPVWRVQRLKGDESPQMIYTRVSSDGRKELRLVSLDATIDRTLPSRDWNFDLRRVRNPSVSPDGSVMSLNVSANEIFFASLDGKWQRKVKYSVTVMGAGVWFADNRSLLITMANEPRMEIGLIENYLAASGRGP
ncbi:MAG: hypothetical protein FJ398_20795 [Verrucomicrobia bacterium]|nr:hypothetical protein [Verrucomicrobiota bacterium]